jgi:hypothetical protein
MIEPMYNLSTDDVIKLFNKFSLIMTAYMTDASNRTGLMNGTLRNNSREITDDDMHYFDNNTKPLYKFDIVLSTIKVNLSIINRDSSLCYTKDAYFTDQVSELIMYVYIPDTKYDTFCTFCDIFGNIFDSTTYGVHEASNIISILFSGVLCDISIDDISPEDVHSFPEWVMLEAIDYGMVPVGNPSSVENLSNMGFRYLTPNNAIDLAKEFKLSSEHVSKTLLHNYNTLIKNAMKSQYFKQFFPSEEF